MALGGARRCRGGSRLAPSRSRNVPRRTLYKHTVLGAGRAYTVRTYSLHTVHVSIRHVSAEPVSIRRVSAESVSIRRVPVKVLTLWMSAAACKKRANCLQNAGRGGAVRAAWCVELPLRLAKRNFKSNVTQLGTF